MWEKLATHSSTESIVRDHGLAQIGDNLVNFCYSLAKSVVLGTASGEKVRDVVLARAIRESPVYKYIGRRTDVGQAADAYEAIFAWLWMNERVDTKTIVENLIPHLHLEPRMNRKKEAEIASVAFKLLLDSVSEYLPHSQNSRE